MKKYLILGTAALAVVAAGAAAQEAGSRPDRPDRNADVTRQQAIERADQRFSRLDLNNDGQATAEEARQAHQQRRAERAGRMFERMDLNSDGNISRAEFDQVHNQRREARSGDGERRGRWHGRRGMRGHGEHGMGRGALFGEQGFITRDQMREQATAQFDRLDANRDGVLTAEERRQAWSQMRERARERRNQAD